MSAPVFLHIMSNGDLWFTNDVNKTVPGTLVGAFRINSDASYQKIGTLSGTVSSSLAVTNALGRYGKELP
jgi:hypothetical protein